MYRKHIQVYVSITNPEISVIIPVYNDPEGLKDTLNSIVNQDLETEEYEVLIVDNGSTDSTSEVIRQFSRQYGNLKGLEENQIQSSYAARNKGIENSMGHLICFLDADMWTGPSYLSDVKAYFEEHQEVEYIGCRVEMINNSSTITGRYNEINGFPVDRYVHEKGFAPTCCLSVRKKIFSDIGLFDQNLVSGGDKLFGKKAKDQRIEMRYIDEITVFHPVRENWRQISAKYFRMGRGWYQKKIHEEKKIEDEEIRLRDILPVSKKIISEIVKDSQDEDLGFVEIITFTFLNFIKKFSMFFGYQYQRLNYLLNRK